ncbi:hypothetical protein [Polynucleobacter nymphae]|uniref:hypothetical protein n=1 Tax=Polynucleobacter nymphae TaxID=2081043 RepID=UPI001C0C949C|nr:hypothetical protein [Polynucleobacter nymphae]MBU3606867.1 hypothetical protein [Polynucleobacter nymphae]
MIKSKISKLNGWQRVYVFICLILAPMAATTVTIPPAPNPDFVRYEFLPKLKPIAKPDDDIDIPGFKYLYMGPKGPGEDTRQYKMPDGEAIYEDNRYSQQEVEYAYTQAKLKSEYEHRDAIIKAVSNAAIKYLLVISLLYFFGWMLGWIYRGFKK